MKFVKICNLCLLIVLLVACAGNQTKIINATKKVKIQDTQSFIPVQMVDEKGNVVPYVMSDNPYLDGKTKISKGSVLLFIEAKKAMRDKNLAKAKQKLSVITKKDHALSGPWVLLGHIAVDNNELQTAQSHYQKAIEINPDNINAYVALAKVQRHIGEFHIAQNTLVSALALWKDCPEAHLNLGILYDLYLNQPKKAQQHLEAYLFLDGYKNKQAIAWFDEVKSRTGIDKSFIKIKNMNKPVSIVSSAQG